MFFNYGGKRFVRRVSSATVLFFMLQLALPFLGGGASEAAVLGGVDAPAPRKEDHIVLEDEQILDSTAETMRKANVLIMMDATAGMGFTPTGVMPSVVLGGYLAKAPSTPADDPMNWTESENDAADWDETKRVYGLNIENIINMTADATYGIGAMPPAWSGVNLKEARNLYGREMDESNNFIKTGSLSGDIAANSGRYYFPFKDDAKGMPAAYASQTSSLEIGYTDYRPGITQMWYSHYSLLGYETGTRVLKNYNYKGLNKAGNAKFPYALVFKDPQYWASGWTGADNPTSADLVPNDSRLYQAKLVLWNLLENKEMWANTRFGLATTFLPLSNQNTTVSYGGSTPPYGRTGTGNRYDFNGLYKVYPFGANAYTNSTFKVGPGDPAGKQYTVAVHNDKKLNAAGTGGAASYAANNTTGKNAAQINAPTGTGIWVGLTKDRWNFKNGVLIQAITGNIRGHNALHSQAYPMWMQYTNETLYSRLLNKDFYRTNVDAMRGVFKSSHRASLWVPMESYEKKWKGTNGQPEMNHVDRVKMWIDGFADLKNATNGQWHSYKNPEIGVAGVFILPYAIYPDPRSSYTMTRANYLANVKTASYSSSAESAATAVWYSSKANHDIYAFTAVAASTESDHPIASPRAKFNKESGEVAGSVLDFFSPKDGMDTSSTTLYGKLIPEQYPIRSACENNWLIVITTGQEVKPIDGTSYTYTTAQAIKNLYDATNKETKDKGRTVTDGHLDFSGGQIYAPYERVALLARNSAGGTLGNPRLVDLDYPIRTLVVGIIPNPDDVPAGPARDEVVNMRLNLTRMAVAGRGGNPDEVTMGNMYDADYQPFIARNTETLTKAIKDAMQVINDSSVVQPAKGAVAQARAIDASEDTSDLFTYKYRIMRSNQWQAELRRYVVSTESDNVYVEYKWKIGERVGEASRNVQFWKPDSLTSSLATLTETAPSFEAYTALNEENIIPPAETTFSGVGPSSAFVKWFMGADYSYVNKKSYNRSHLLTDFGQGATVVVQNPATSVDFLPGYKEWTATLLPTAKSVLYGQTNDGLLHLVDHDSGNTLNTIAPPPSLLPKRLGMITTLPAVSGDKRQWVNILGPESVGGFRSYPVYTLDGALQRREFDISQSGAPSGWGTYLLGALGRGGSGLYMLDVTSHQSPSFMWYKERVGNYLVRSSGGSLQAVSSLADTDPDKVWMKMGFNSPRPVMSVTHRQVGADDKPQNFIALAGGAQYKRNLNDNGKDGAALLILEPRDGSVLKSFTGSSIAGSWRVGNNVTGAFPYMGMMVSEPSLLSSNTSGDLGQYLIGAMLTADNQGNIFRVDMEDADGRARTADNWDIRTIATLLKTTDISAGSAKSYSMPHGLVSGRGKGYMWAAGGTSDVQVMKEAAADYEEGYIRNDEQLFFAFKTNKAQTAPYIRDNDFKALTDLPESGYNPNHNGGETDSDAAYSGWYIPLRPGSAEHFGEYVSTKPALINGTLYVATFKRKGKTAIDDSSVCVTARQYDGDSRLFALDVSTGLGNTWDSVDGKAPKFVEFKGVKIVSLTDMQSGAKGKLLINFDILNEYNNNIADIKFQQSKLHDVRDKTTNAPVPDMAALEEALPPSGGSFPPGVKMLHYWIKED